MISDPQTNLNDGILDRAKELFRDLEDLPLQEKVEALNALRRLLHSHSPFSQEPVDCMMWIPADQVHGNDYNPNSVAPPEMRLLERSIRMDGYTQPLVAHFEHGTYEVVDGFHRKMIGKKVLDIRRRLQGYLPVVSIRAGRCDRKDRVAATIRHNRARGVHAMPPMIEIVRALLGAQWSDADVARELGMDPDEVFRFMQLGGLPEVFQHEPYSAAWR